MKYFNLRGTNGSGKTHVARALLDITAAKPVWYEKNKPLMYEGTFKGMPFHILGSYETACGGCDTIPSVGKVAALLTELKPLTGITFYEGLMISHMIGTVGATVRPWGWAHVMAFLDTPLDTCIERVRARRLEKGNLKPFDPTRTLVKDFVAVKAARKNAIHQGFHVISIDHKDAVENVFLALEQLCEPKRKT